MKLSTFKEKLKTTSNLKFKLPNGEFIPNHFHVTEVGCITKNFIDCGGTVREEKVVNFQLWYSNDMEHRLKSEKLLNIIALSESKLDIQDFEIEVEYQADTIGKFGLSFSDDAFVLTNKMTDCLAPDKCEVPETKTKVNLSQLLVKSNGCDPKSGCC